MVLAHSCVCTIEHSSRPQTQPKLLTMDILVLATMKNAAKCDTQCELQNSVNHQNFERILRSEVFLRACLSQWHLPLSPCVFAHVESGRQDCEPSEVSLSVERTLCRSKSRVGPLGDTSQTVSAQRSVVVGCLLCIPSDRCRCGAWDGCLPHQERCFQLDRTARGVSSMSSP